MSVHGSGDSGASGGPTLDDVGRQLDRIASNPIFRRSDILRSILAFLVQGYLQSPDASFKEHEIATQALGRSNDFDPRVDSTIRVHTARLRTKLAEYYAGEGANDTVIFEIPKGAYQLVPRLAESPPALAGPVLAPAASGLRRWAVPVWAGLATIAALAMALMPATERRPQPPAALRTLWSDLVGPGQQTTLVFSTSRFLATPEGLLHLPSTPVPPERINDSYVGVGEVYGVSALSSLFAQYWRQPQVKCGRFLTWDDARQQHLVFAGGPNVNLHLGRLPELQRFPFVRSAIQDAQSDPAAPVRFGHSGKPYTFDHAVVAMFPSGTGRRMVVLAGNTTLGTQAAADFVTREETAQQLLDALKCPHGGAVPPFEVLIKTKAIDAVPVQSQILHVHLRK